MKNVRLKNISGALLTVTPGKGRGLHFLVGATMSVSASALESPDIARLIKKGFLVVVESEDQKANKKHEKRR